MPDKLTVLVVDDEPLVAMFVSDELQDADFDCEVCHSAAEAITALEKGDPLYCALVTDIRLGNQQTGWDVARCARIMRADMPVVYITGDSATDHPAHGVPASIVIQKPFVGAQLVTAIATLLNKV